MRSCSFVLTSSRSLTCRHSAIKPSCIHPLCGDVYNWCSSIASATLDSGTSATYLGAWTLGKVYFCALSTGSCFVLYAYLRSWIFRTLRIKFIFFKYGFRKKNKTAHLKILGLLEIWRLAQEVHEVHEVMRSAAIWCRSSGSWPCLESSFDLCCRWIQDGGPTLSSPQLHWLHFIPSFMVSEAFGIFFVHFACSVFCCFCKSD